MLQGQKFGDFAVGELLGSGRFGKIYLATQEPFERRVAIKLIRDSGIALRQVWQRFFRETRAMAQVEHPHVIPIYAAGHEDKYFYIAMRYLKDGTLADRISTSQSLAKSLIIQWMRQLTWAAATAHARGVVHRDIKPQNILFDKDIAFLTDFGLARVTDMMQITVTGDLIGTPLYMPPEALLGEAALTPHRDVYALGVVFYELCTGSHPFVSASSSVLPFSEQCFLLAESIRSGAYKRIDETRGEGWSEIDEVVSRCLQREADLRYSDAGELLAAIEMLTD